MATVDTQWPSEDEDFDAVHDGKPILADPIKHKVQVAEEKPAPAKTVAVQDTEPEAEATNDQAYEDEIDQAFSEEAEADEDTQQAYEPETDQPADIYDDEQPDEQPGQVDQLYEQPAAAELQQPDPIVAHTREPRPPRDNAGMVRTLFEFVLIVLLAGLGVFAYTLYSDKDNLKDQVKTLDSQVTELKSNPQVAVQKQTDDLIAKVGALMQLPKDETPTVANVSDVAQARKQSAFFNNAENNDKVLMYVKAGQAILYRPSTQKIVLVAPLTFNGAAAVTTKTP